MKCRCPGAQFLGRGILPGYRFIIYSRGYASVVKDAEATVWGGIWKISHSHLVTLDNYEGIMPLHRVELPGDTPLTLAVGSERGWSSKERDLLRSAGYQLAGLGSRVLRAETATIAALAVIKAATGGWDTGPTVDTRV